LLRQAVRLARSLAFASAGKSIAARIAMMAITTSKFDQGEPAFHFHNGFYIRRNCFCPLPFACYLLTVDCAQHFCAGGDKLLLGAGKMAHCRRAKTRKTANRNRQCACVH
jgi:hypothetical protein